jgi:anhydro-N-acetylmuramic acid kinase
LKKFPRKGTEYYVGLMSGTSLDGIDAVLAEIDQDGTTRLVDNCYRPYPEDLREHLLALHTPQTDELHLAALAGNVLARHYADTVNRLLSLVEESRTVRAIGCHGQTLRHRPESGYTLQIGNAALLAELTGTTVVADFRSRDIAAGGQGAPLVPAFHAAQLQHPERHRVIVNLGGIANITDLPPGGPVRGWDTGPGNLLMDAWIHQTLGKRYDEDGAWASSGKVNQRLLETLSSHPYFQQNPPKSAGREQFNIAWIEEAKLELKLATFEAADVQSTLLELTARTLCESISQECPDVREVFVCGGGVHNHHMMQRIGALLDPVSVASTEAVGIAPDWMEALAFAWLARQALHQQTSSIPAVTGARGARILGAIYPA